MRVESLHDSLAYFPDPEGLWRPDDLTVTEAGIRDRLVATVEEAKSVELLCQLARVQALKGDLPAARASLEQARQIRETNLPAEPALEVRWLLEQGRVFCLSMSPAKAHDVFVNAWTLSVAHGLTFFSIDAALMLSTVRPPKFQNEWLQKALQLAEGSTDSTSRMWLAQLYFLDGWHAYDFRQYEKALESFDRSLKQPMVAGDEVKRRPLLWSRARALRALNRVREALEIQEELFRSMSQTGSVSGHVHLELAECLQLLNRHEDAKKNFETAYAVLSADGWYSDNRADELTRMKYLSKKR